MSYVLCIMSHTISHTMFALFPIQGSESPAVGLNSQRFICRFCSFWFHYPVPVLLQQPFSIATPAPPIPPSPAGPIAPLAGLPSHHDIFRVTWLQQLCCCHHCCAAAATAVKQALAAGAPDCGIADPWIDVHARMAITMLLISRRNRTCRLSCVSKRSAIMKQS